jgi:hypothetical protein
MIQKDGWQILQHDYWSNNIFYSLVRRTPDTVYYLDINIVQHDSIWNPGEIVYSVSAFRKVFRNEGFEYVLNGLRDTNYYYKYPRNNPDSLVFITGKYYYLYRYNLLNFNQKNYYLKHADSLNKIKGNNLPIIPELDATK